MLKGLKWFKKKDVQWKMCCYLLITGFVVGQAGLYHSIAMFLVAYFIITMTVLSICAISTNGALDAGGAYCILLLLRKGSGLSNHTLFMNPLTHLFFPSDLLYCCISSSCTGISFVSFQVFSCLLKGKYWDQVFGILYFRIWLQSKVFSWLWLKMSWGYVREDVKEMSFIFRKR